MARDRPSPYGEKGGFRMPQHGGLSPVCDQAITNYRACPFTVARGPVPRDRYHHDVFLGPTDLKTAPFFTVVRKDGEGQALALR